MTDLIELTRILKSIPIIKLREISLYISDKKNSELSIADMETSLSINSSDMENIKKLFVNFHNLNSYSILIDTFLENQIHNGVLITKLVVTSNIHHQGVSSTHDEIFKMLYNARNKIIVVGFWVYSFPQFFETLQKIQVESEHPIDIEFYFNDTKKWKNTILNGWPIGFVPKIFGINTEHDKGKVKKMKRLHAKMIIIDDKECLITSANLTENAMETNIEVGVWTCDKKIVKDSINFLKQLKNDGILIPV